MNDKLTDLLFEINVEIEEFKNNSEKHKEKGNKAAGQRARKASMKLTKLFKDYRAESIKA